MKDGKQEILEDLQIVDQYFFEMFNKARRGGKMYIDLEEKVANAIEWIENMMPDSVPLDEKAIS